MRLGACEQFVVLAAETVQVASLVRIELFGRFERLIAGRARRMLVLHMFFQADLVAVLSLTGGADVGSSLVGGLGLWNCLCMQTKTSLIALMLS